MRGHVAEFFARAKLTCEQIDEPLIESLVAELVALRGRGGRLFFIGVGGSAANCSHAVNDFRKLCGIEAYTPVDNVSELTARANDEGWDTIFSSWLESSRLCSSDAIFIFSVGGGDIRRNVSTNIAKAIDFAQKNGAKVFGVVGKETGYTAKMADIVIIIPQTNAAWVTPLSEAFQAVVWHCLVSHPALQVRETMW